MQRKIRGGALDVVLQHGDKFADCAVGYSANVVVDDVDTEIFLELKKQLEGAERVESEIRQGRVRFHRDIACRMAQQEFLYVQKKGGR